MPMPAAEVPADEENRLADLAKLEFLDTDQTPPWHRIVRLASVICGTPIALVGVIDENRHWFKARVGTDMRENTRDDAVCAHALGSDELLEVEDLLNDARFNDNPLVTGGPHLRFYAGVPIRSPWGRRLGTVCVYDQKPRTLTEDQRQALRDLAAQANELFALRMQALQLRDLGVGGDTEQSQQERTQGIINETRHDLVTPLTAAINYLAIIEHGLAKLGESMTAVDAAKRNLRRLQDVIEMISQKLQDET